MDPLEIEIGIEIGIDSVADTDFDTDTYTDTHADPGEPSASAQRTLRRRRSSKGPPSGRFH
jgi:hypothetical protein